MDTKSQTEEQINENSSGNEDASSLSILKGKIKTDEDPEYDKKYKSARWGVISFCIIHFFYETLVGNTISAASLILVNYFISMFIVTWRLTNNRDIKLTYLLGLSIACIIFVIRLIVGTIIFYLITS